MLGNIITVNSDFVVIKGDNGKKYLDYILDFDDTPKYSYTFKVGQRVWFKPLGAKDYISGADDYASNICIDCGSVWDKIKCREAEFDDWGIEDCKEVYKKNKEGFFCVPSNIYVYGADGSVKEYVGEFLKFRMHSGIIEICRRDIIYDGVQESERLPKEAKITIDINSIKISSSGAMMDMNLGYVDFESSCFICTGISQTNKIEVSIRSIEQYNCFLMLLKYTLYVFKNAEVLDKIEFKGYSYDELTLKDCQEIVRINHYRYIFKAKCNQLSGDISFSFDIKNKLLVGLSDSAKICVNFSDKEVTVSPFPVLGCLTISNVSIEIIQGENCVADDSVDLYFEEYDYETCNKITTFIKYILSDCVDEDLLYIDNQLHKDFPDTSNDAIKKIESFMNKINNLFH